MNRSLFHTLFKRATYAFAGTFIGRISSALAGLLMARALQTQMFGIYSTLWELTLLCGNLTETGMNVGIQRDGAINPNKLGKLLGNALSVRLFIGIPALIIAYFCSFKMTHGYSNGIVYFFLSLASAAVFLSEPMYSVLQVLGKQKNVAFIESLRGMLTLLAISSMIAFHRGIMEMACVQGIVYCLVFALLCRMTLKSVRISVNLKEAINQFKSSFVYGISSWLVSIYSRIPILFLSYIKGPVAVGYYSVAYRIISILYVVAAGVCLRAFLPSLFAYHQKGFKAFQTAGNFMQQYFFIFGIAIAAVVYVAADSIISIFMGASYHDSIGIIRILCISVFVFYMLSAADASMTAANKNLIKILFQGAGTVVGAGIAYFLIARFGAWGAAYTDNLIRLVQFFMFFAFVYKFQYFDINAILKYLIPLSIIAVLGIISVNVMPNAYIVRPLLFGCVTIIILVTMVGPLKMRDLLLRRRSEINEKEQI